MTTRSARTRVALLAAALAGTSAYLIPFSTAASVDIPPGYELVAAHSGMAALVNGPPELDGTPVVQWPGNGGGNQRWVPLAFGDAFVFVNVSNGTVLDVAGASTQNGAIVIQHQWSGSASQVWRLYPFGPTHYVFINLGSGKALDVAGASTVPGAPVIQWDWIAGSNQVWREVVVGIPPPE